MKKLTTIVIISFVFLTNSFGQNSGLSEKDSLMKFLVRGLWIQYEIEKGWNPNNDTLIQFSESEKDIYYRNILANFCSDSSEFQNDSLYISVPRYTESTAELFEKKTIYKRTFNYTNHRILLFSKELIENWTDWYVNNPDSVDIDELKEIISSVLFAQSRENLISYIDSLRDNKLLKESDGSMSFRSIHADGQSVESKFFFGLFHKQRIVGGFSENYTLKDTLMVKSSIGERKFLNKKKTQSTNNVRQFVYDNEEVRYYNEKLYFENDGEPDSLIYEIEFYILNDTILKFNKTGNFNSDIKAYLDKIISEAIENKKEKTRFVNRDKYLK